ncbi:MAG: tripartite tricarboxylate transporter substrate binding protein [Burkholderiales bacterium]|nr:tripartite tricarboxylate transporter substrate binding protein [Burkholderiales bacterium]
MIINHFFPPVLALALLVSGAPAMGADATKNYPNRPIRMLMPNAPGSSTDTLGRVVANKLGEVLGQQVVVDNRAGAGGVIGMEIAKTANPDGYTMISASSAAMSIAPHIHKKLSYDPLNDYAFLSLFAVTPNVLVVNPGLPVRSVKDLIDLTKSKPGQINMASAGAGSQSHLAGVLLQSMGKFESLHVPYKGGGSTPAVAAGESHWSINPAPSVTSLVKAGRLRAIAHTLPGRSPLLGDMPAIAETVPGYSYSGWQGMLAPKATPKPILDKLRAALLKTMSLPEIKTALATQGAEIVTNSPEEFRKFVQDESAKIGPVVKSAGLKVE